MRRAGIGLALVTLLTGGAPLLGLTPQQAFAAALQDAKRLPPGQAQDVRYLWAGMYGEAKDGIVKREQLYLALVLAINSASRSAISVVPYRVRPDLWRIYLSDLGWRREVYEKLAEVDPYFHAKLAGALQAAPSPPSIAVAPRVRIRKEQRTRELAVGDQVTTRAGCRAFDQNTRDLRGIFAAGFKLKVVEIAGKGAHLLVDDTVGSLVWVRRKEVVLPNLTEEVEIEEKVEAPAPTPAKDSPRLPRWLPARALAELIVLTQSQTPLLRADYLLVQALRQVDLEERQQVGYYDLLGIKEEKDIEKLAGLDRKVALERQSEVRAIIPISGVALHNRQVASPMPGYWESLDVTDSVGEHNAVRQLDQDYKPQAKEVYFRLPNGMWGLAAVNAANGKLAATVPDNVASDKRTSSNDHRIHPGLSCIRCHVEGLRPMEDWARSFYGPPGDTKLTAVDPDKQRRLRQLYLGPLQDRYEDDQRSYTRTLAKLTGQTPVQASKAIASAWSEYVDEPVTGEQLARELGVSGKSLRAAFAEYAQNNPGAGDPVLLGYLKHPEQPARREYIREAYVLMQLALLEYRPHEGDGGYGGGP